MSRPVFIGNGQMLVGLNSYGLVHDFYYPYIGMENHATATTLRHKVGIWVDGVFSWLDDDSWQIKLNYEEDAMIGYSVARNKTLQIAIEFHDFVDAKYNVFARNLHVINLSDREREVRVFMHQVFQISESARGDTALYIPDDNVILDYKGNRAFVIYGEDEEGNSFDQYSIGNFGIEGKEGTYRDAEDGNLEKNAVEHGHIDSAIRFRTIIPKHSSKRLHYWIAAALTNVDALKLHNKIKAQGLNERYEATQAYWLEWLSQGSKTIQKVERKYSAAFKKSMFIIKSHMDKRGAVIASGDSQMLNYARDYYSYCWPRDAAYVIWPLIRMGFKDEAKAYFEFARDVLTEDGYLMHKYLPDRSIGSSWHPYVHEHHKELPIQEDELALTVYMIGEYLEYSKDKEFVQKIYPTLVRPAADFMEGYIDKQTKLPHASYDLWEERFQTTTYTTGVVYGALKTAAKLAKIFEYPDDAVRWDIMADEIKTAAHETLFNEERGYFYRGYLLREDSSQDFDDVIDVASLFGASTFGLFDIKSQQVSSSLKKLKEELVNSSPSGGVPRYEYDQYNRCEPAHKGNPWFVTTLWYAQMFAELGDTAEVKVWLDWTTSKMLPSAVLPEQINPNDSSAVSVAPLVWSHAEFINTVIDITDT